MPRKKVEEEKKAVLEEIASLPTDETPAKKPSKRKAKAEENIEELIIDGTPAEDIVEELDPKEVRLRQIYSSQRSIKYAKKDTLKKLAKENQTDDGWRYSEEEKVKNEYDLLREETSMLSLLVDNSKKELVTVHLSGIEPDEDIAWVVVGKIKSRGANAQYKIKIAVSELTTYSQTDFESLSIETEEQLTRTLKDIASRWIGTDVEVVINKVYEERQEAYASRLAASEMLARYNFRKLMPNTKKPRYTIGSKVKAQVVEVKRDRLKVSVFGQDAWIKSDEIYWSYAQPVYDNFSVGDKVNVLITDIIPDFVYNDYHLAKLVVSIKQATPNPLIKLFPRYLISGEYEAEPLYPTKSGRYMCITEDGMNILATPAAVGRIGDRVKIRITGKDEQTMKVWGDIVNPRIR